MATFSSAVTRDQYGNIFYGLDPDTPYRPLSTIKTLTAHHVIKLVANPHTETATVASNDLVSGSTASLQEGDILTITDLLYGLMLPSGNDAGNVLAAYVGQKLLDAEGSSREDPKNRFLEEMRATATEWGWTDFIIVSPSGYPETLPGSALSARQLADMIVKTDTLTPWLTQIMGTYQYTGTVTGPNARTINWTSTTDPDGAVPFPEMVGAKTGSINQRGFLVMIWDHPVTGKRYYSSLMESVRTERFADMREMMDAVIAQTSDPVDGVTVGGKKVGAMRVGTKTVLAVKHGTQTVWEA